MPSPSTVSSELADGRFVELEPIGSGATGSVFRARDVEDGSEVALKIAHGEDGRAALAQEALLASLTPSPRLPELRALGTTRKLRIPTEPADGERAFLALRWVEGQPARPGSVEHALRIAIDVGDALAELHALGFAHGDLKRQNVIVSSESRAALIDLGLAGPASSREVRGGTPRMLASGDADLGDARSRDLVALGALLAELCVPELADAADLITKARAIALPTPIRGLCDALLAPAPGARPSARWVASSARRLVGERETDDPDRDRRWVRASYLRLRLAELGTARAVSEAAAPWMHDAMHVANRARELGGSGDSADPPREDEPIGRLTPHQLARWLVAMCGPSAGTWPLAAWYELPEPQIAERLTELAGFKAPELWSVGDFEEARTGRPPSAASPPNRTSGATPTASLTADAAAQLALGLAETPPSRAAISEIELRDDAPPTLVLAAADALRRSGQLGRARSLVLRPDVSTLPGTDALQAEILRRAGDVERAEVSAQRMLAVADAEDEAPAHRDAISRASAVLARIALDAGEIDEAERRLSTARSCAATREVAALVASARGERAAALDHAAQSEALARSPEEHARAQALRGYVHHGAEPHEALNAFGAAAQHAARAGAVVEEASYRTGEAASAVDVGELATAISASRRAALLWDHLGRPEMATRAQLATAAAFATAGAEHQTLSAARDAMESARAAGDRRAEAYAQWAIADVLSPGDPRAQRAARLATELLGDDASEEDRLRAAARTLLHGGLDDGLDDEAAESFDHAATSSESLTSAARLEWWGARARSELRQRAAPEEGRPRRRPELPLSALTALCAARAPVHARGPALAAGYELATHLGQGEVARRLLGTLGETARELTRRAPSELVDSVRSLPWVMRAASERDPGIGAEQVRDLEQLIRSLGEREKLGTLLNRIVDALVLWTGVERGLLLLRAPDGKLVPRAARNLARSDLVGEQVVLSQTLARRALEAREPVVAVDAAGELPSVHRSVHSLQLRSVLAIPLLARGEALGVVYLDDRVRRGAFGSKELAWTRTIGTLAAMLIADARDQALLRRAARRASRASAQLTEALARGEAKLEVALRELAETKTSRGTRFAYDAIVGESPAIRTMLGTVDRVAASDIPVLLIGESGSGKELVARAIHDHGARKDKSFVSENCGAIPEGLLESTLFGHVRGAFTGADRPRAGLFDVADQGTLFLDEIGEMSLPMQAKLLRVLEDGVLRPLGTTRTRKVDVRVIAATHRDLAGMVQDKTFREDLYYRLNIITLPIPPLRERPTDIPLLVRHLMDKHGPRSDASGDDSAAPRVTRAALDRLVAYRWPGNVRELENQIRRALVLCDGTIDREHLTPDIADLTPVASAHDALNVRSRVDALEVMLVREALEKTGGNQTQAAKLLGLSRFGLQKMIKRLNI